MSYENLDGVLGSLRACDLNKYLMLDRKDERLAASYVSMLPRFDGSKKIRHKCSEFGRICPSSDELIKKLSLLHNIHSERKQHIKWIKGVVMFRFLYFL